MLLRLDLIFKTERDCHLLQNQYAGFSTGTLYANPLSASKCYPCPPDFIWAVGSIMLTRLPSVSKNEM